MTARYVPHPPNQIGGKPQTNAPVHAQSSRAVSQKHWFSDLKITAKGVLDRRTGRIIGLNQLTLVELAKFLGYFALVLVEAGRARSKGESVSVWFTPEKPPPWYVVWSAMALSGARFAKCAEDGDAIMYFEDRTRATPPVIPGRGILNGGCADISKSRVAAVFEAVAGYPLSLNPRRHRGFAVEKSEENGAHDGRLVQCPLTPAPDKTYQRFIDCSDGPGIFERPSLGVSRALYWSNPSRQGNGFPSIMPLFTIVNWTQFSIRAKSRF